MKVYAKSRNGKMLKIGTDEKSAKWYFLSDQVVKFAEKGISTGDEVTFNADENGGKYTITYITKGQGEKPTSTTKTDAKPNTSTYPKPKTDYPTKKYYGKSPVEQATIKRQAIGHMVSRTLISLQGHVDLNNIEEIAESLYKKYRDLVG